MKNLETGSRPGKPINHQLFQDKSNLTENQHAIFVPDEKTLETLVRADALATSRQALVKIWIARV